MQTSDQCSHLWNHFNVNIINFISYKMEFLGFEFRFWLVITIQLNNDSTDTKSDLYTYYNNNMILHSKE